MTQGLTGVGTAGEAVTTGAAGLLQNYAEGKMLGLEFIEQSKDALSERLRAEAIDNGIEGEAIDAYVTGKMQTDYADYDDLLAKGSDTIQDMNKVFAALDIFGLHGIFKGVGSTRNIIKDRGAKPWLKSFVELNADNPILQGMKEAIEEMSQNAFQAEADYQTKLATGELTAEDMLDYDNNFFKRMLDFATEDEAIVEGLLGFFSGGPQRLMTQAFTGQFTKGSRERFKQALAEQQAELNSYTSSELAKIVRFEDVKEDAIINGDMSSFDFANNMMMGKKFIKAFQVGTTEQLEAHLQDVANLTPEQAAAKGFDENYKEQAEAALEKLSIAESI